MILSREQQKRLNKEMEQLAIIRKGDNVKLVNCYEATFEKNQNRTFEVLDEPKKIGGAWCVRLEQHGWFDITMVEKVEDKANV